MKTLILQRSTAAQVLTSGLTKEARAEILTSMEGESVEDGPAVTVILQEFAFSEWKSHLENPLNQVSRDTTFALEGAFALALGATVEPDKRWILN